MEKMHDYNNYEEYVTFQLKKTSDKKKQSLWLGSEWQEKIDIFIKLFQSNMSIIKNKHNGICLGSRTGQEVVALKNIGVSDCIGIDLHEFKPYTIKGDIHKIDFPDETFDIAFSNIFDHSLYPEKFASETYRVLQKNGIFILHVRLGIDLDEYTEFCIKNKQSLIELFNNFTLLKEGKIESGKIGMNYEFIFQK